MDILVDGTIYAILANLYFWSLILFVKQEVES